MCRLYTDLTNREGIVALNKTFDRIQDPPQGDLFGYDDKKPAKPWAIRTTDEGRVVRQDGVWTVDLMRWSLVPSWAKELKFGVQCVNARSDTVAEKPAFRRAFKLRRCLVPASSWVEWREETLPGEKKPIKQPYRLELGNGAPLLFRGAVGVLVAEEPGRIARRAGAVVCHRHLRSLALRCTGSRPHAGTAPPDDALKLLRGYTGSLVARPVHRDIGSNERASAVSLEPIGPALERVAA